ncbi:tyrosine-type recombinase/integrase [Pseudomonadota bacterium]
MLFLTGARLNEIRSLKWAEVDIDAGELSLSSIRTKSGKRHIIPLSTLAVDILKSTPYFKNDATDPEHYVFASNRTELTKPYSGLSKSKKRIDEESGVTGWRVHDIRHAVATGLARLNIPPHIISRILGHAQQDITSRVYSHHEYVSERKKALEQWALCLLEMVEGDKNKVVPIHG